MNAKICKKLRREAHKQTVGMPSRRLTWMDRRSPTNTKMAWIINDPASTRGVYLALKRKYGVA